MSFMSTLTALAAGFAAAKGYDKYRDMGGMPGVKEALRANPALKGWLDQAEGAAGKAGAQARAGFAGLIGALGGAAASGAQTMSSMLDQMTGTTAATQAMEANARLMIRAMIQAAKADGEISPEERATIEAHLSDASAEELAFVRAEMDRDVDPLALAADAGTEMRAQVYGAAAAMARYDTDAERQFLDTLASALSLDDATRRGIHAGIGMAPPQA